LGVHKVQIGECRLRELREDCPTDKRSPRLSCPRSSDRVAPRLCDGARCVLPQCRHRRSRPSWPPGSTAHNLHHKIPASSGPGLCNLRARAGAAYQNQRRPGHRKVLCGKSNTFQISTTAAYDGGTTHSHVRREDMQRAKCSRKVRTWRRCSLTHTCSVDGRIFPRQRRVTPI